MDLIAFYTSDIFKWVIIPILIFCARLIDVSLGTLRIIYLSRGVKYLVPLIGFIEINIWLLAIGQIMMNLDNIVCAFAYAAGFATGNFIGILIEERLSIGTVIIRVIVKHDTTQIIDCFKKKGYTVTTVDAQGETGPVKLIFAVIRREDLKEIISQIKHIHPRAFYSVEDVRTVSEGMFPSRRHRRRIPTGLRKGK